MEGNEQEEEEVPVQGTVLSKGACQPAHSSLGEARGKDNEKAFGLS